MRIQLSQLRSIIKEEISRLFESSESPAVKSVLENEDLIDISDKIRDMEKQKVSPAAIVKFVEGSLTGDVKSAIQYVLHNASPSQLSKLQYEATFGDVDAMSDEYSKTLLSDPLQALQAVKMRLSKNRPLRGLGILGLQLQSVHEILDELLMGGPIGRPKRKGIFGFLSP